MLEPGNSVTPDNHFDALLKFRKKQEDILKRFEQLKVTAAPYSVERTYDQKYTSTRSTEKNNHEHSCIVCGDNKHRDKAYFCKR